MKKSKIQAEDTIEASERRLKDITFDMSDWVWEVDENCTYTYCSRNGLDLLGLKREKVIGKTLFDFMPSDEAKRVAAIINETMANKEPIIDLEIWIAGMHGKRACLLSNGLPILDEEGNLKGYRGVGRNITKRKQVEDALQNSEAFFKSVVQNSADLIVLTNEKGLTTYMSPQCEMVLGYPSSHFIGRIMPDIIHPDDMIKCRKAWEQVFHLGKEQHEFEYRIIDSQDKVRWLSHSAKLVRNKEKSLGMQNTIRDITKQKQADASLRESEELYRSILKASPDNITITDMDCHVLITSPAGMAMFGYDREDELLGREIAGFIAPHDRDRALSNLALMFQGVLKGPEEYQGLHKNGSTFDIEVNGDFILGPEGQPVKIIFITRNITERKKTEEKLKSSLDQLRQLTQYIEKVREKERLAISRELHDELGQALTAVKIDLGIIRRAISDNEETTVKINKVSSLVSETIKTVQRLTSQLRPQIIDDLGLDAAIEWYTNEYAERNGIKVLLNIDTAISFSPEASLIIFRIMQESLTNIARHSGATRVDITLVKNGDNINFRISDNGTGITEKQIRSKKSFGIMSMMERAASLGGTFDIYHENEGGTVIMLIFPQNLNNA